MSKDLKPESRVKFHLFDSHVEISRQSLEPFLSPREISAAAGTSRFFNELKAVSEAKYFERAKLLFSDAPRLRIIERTLKASTRTVRRKETYKELYNRMNSLYCEISKAFAKQAEGDEKKPSTQEMNQLFLQVIINGFDKFDQHFPNLKNNIDIDYIYNQDHNLLDAAIYYNMFFFVNFIISRGGDIYTIDKEGYTPLMYAATYGYSNCMALLLMKAEKDDKVQEYIDAGDNFTPLHLAAYASSPACVSMLLNSGARTDLEDHVPRTAYASAAYGRGSKQDREVCKELIRQKMLERGQSLSSCSIM